YLRKTDMKIVGMLGVRHRPTEPIETWGGHVGYCVCPSERRKGYAKAMLRDVLPYCKSIGLDRILLTAGDENKGSVRTILANGGVLENYVLSPRHQIMVGRYWIET
ncbi:MAG: GNAT family N-acetyltransferase, partial [Clostridia bacterium]|nr:GNAT family N-acetyltransferase [Clostridia bacterium]